MKNTKHKIIGIISDTHGLLRDTVKEQLACCDVILHCGDIDSPKIMDELNAIAKTYAVRGNVDKDWASELPQTIRLTLFGIKIFMIHNKRQIREDISDCHLVLYGHSHKYNESHKNGQFWLNPGSCGVKRFNLPLSMVLLHVKEDASFEIERIDLSSATSASDLNSLSQADIKSIILAVMKDTDRKKTVAAIAKKNHISEELATQICRLYLTHPGVSADGILGKMGL